MEFVGEVDFFDENSPYIELLSGIETEYKLINILEDKNMPESAIKNIIQRLENLKVLKDGILENIEDGFPNKEYGKYTLEIFKNDTTLPFKFKNKDIKREKAVSRNTADDIKQDKNYIKMVQDKSNDKFRINSISNDKAKILSVGTNELIIRLDSSKWKYSINDKSYDMESISYSDLFKGEWDYENDSLMISFSIIKEKDDFLKSFKITYSDDIESNKYGKLKGRFKDIPVIPKEQYDAKEWFIFLLKSEIEQLNRYISKEELQQLWNNTKEKYPKFNKFELGFDFENILKEFGKSSKYYWLLQAGIDLYPFDISISSKSRVIIENIEDFKYKFGIKIQELIIVDRYINTIRHFKVLEEVVRNLNYPKITIITTKIYNSNDKQEIDEIISSNNITRIIKEKYELPHSRYWVFNDDVFYKVGESLDSIQNTSFDKYSQDEIQKFDNKCIELLNREIR